MIRRAQSFSIGEAATVSILLSVLVFLPQWRFGFNLGDEGLLWYLSQRIVAGDLPIRDFFGYDLGRYVWAAGWFTVLGHDGLLEQRIANAAFGAIGLGFAYASLISARIPRTWRIVAAVLIAMALGFPRHKTYEQALSLISVAATLFVLLRPASTGRWIAYGMAAGLAALIGRNSGVYFVVAAAFVLVSTGKDCSLKVSLKRATAYGLGVVIGYAPMLWLLSMDARFRDAFIQSIAFTPHWQLPLPIPFPWRQPPNLSSVFGLQLTAVSFLCIVVIAVYAVAVWRFIKQRRCNAGDSPAAMLETAALFAGLPYLHQAFDRADFSHIAQGIMPIFVLVLAQCFGYRRRLFIAQYAVVAALACLAWIPLQPRVYAALVSRQDLSAQTNFEIAGQNFLVDSSQAAIMAVAKRESHRCTLRDGEFLEAPHYPGLYAYLHLRAPIWDTYFLYQRSTAFQTAEIQSMQRLMPRVVLLNETVTMDGKRSLLLGNSNPLLMHFVHANYQQQDTTAGLPDGVEIFESGCEAKGP